SPEHLSEFKLLINNVIEKYSQRLHVKYIVEYSVQKASTDTIAVDNQNQPFRETNGSLVFRPGGHGALLENLNEIEGDIVFIKNIDNVVPDQLKEVTVLYKKALAGLLIQTKNRIFTYEKLLEQGSLDQNHLPKIRDFIETWLGVKLSAGFINF